MDDDECVNRNFVILHLLKINDKIKKCCCSDLKGTRHKSCLIESGGNVSKNRVACEGLHSMRFFHTIPPDRLGLVSHDTIVAPTRHD